MSSDFPLSVRSRNFSFFFLSQQGEGGCVFAVFFAPIPEKGILDFIAHGSIIQVLTVGLLAPGRLGKIRVTHLAISLTAAGDLVWDMYLFVEPIRSVRAFIAGIPSSPVHPSLV